MKKKPSLKTLKRNAWKVFAIFIKKRGASVLGYANCVTCWKQDMWQNMDAGHFIHGHSKPTFFDDRNVHPQCVRCNHYLSGNLIEYSNYMKKTYGWETIDALRELSHQVIKFNRDYYEGIIEKYKEK